MYKYYNIAQLQENAENAARVVIDGLGVSVYIDSNPDDVSPDFVIDPADAKGIELFREFAAKMAKHYKTLK